MGEPHQIGVVAGRIDHNDVVRMLDGAYSLGEAGELLRLVCFEGGRLAALHAVVRRQLECNARGPGAAVLNVVGEALLAAVEIDRGDALAGLELRHRDVQRGRGLA